MDLARQKLLWDVGFGFWISIYYHLVMLLPPLVLAPMYFDGEIEFGAIAQVSESIAKHIGHTLYFSAGWFCIWLFVWFSVAVGHTIPGSVQPRGRG